MKDLLLQWWPVIVTAASTSMAWVAAPRLKLRLLRAHTEVDSVKATVAMDDLIQDKLKRMNATIDNHTEQIEELRVALLDARLENRTLQYTIAQRDTRIAELEAVLAKRDHQNPPT